jgi:hypothetical protein
VALAEQPVHHFAAHHAKPDKSKIRHESLFSSEETASKPFHASRSFWRISFRRALVPRSQLESLKFRKSMRENPSPNANFLSY